MHPVEQQMMKPRSKPSYNLLPCEGEDRWEAWENTTLRTRVVCVGTFAQVLENLHLRSQQTLV